MDDLEGMMLSEISHRQTLYDLMHMWNLTKQKTEEEAKLKEKEITSVVTKKRGAN